METQASPADVKEMTRRIERGVSKLERQVGVSTRRSTDRGKGSADKPEGFREMNE